MRTNLKFPDNGHIGWIYFGAQPEVNMEVIIRNIYDHFDSDDLFIALGRNDSFQCTKANVLDSIENILGAKKFSIWNPSFTRVIDFNEIGVLRCGKKVDS